MVVPIKTRPAVPLAVLARLLNSATIDHAFRCISGSVAVSAYEMENLPLPAPVALMQRIRWSRVTAETTGGPEFETAIESLLS